jgi:uncharacterized protein DUF6084
MPDLHFHVDAAEPQPNAAAPLLLFKLRVTDATGVPCPIQSVALRCQVRVEPARRRYSEMEKERLLDLFGTPERWGQTVRPMSWTQVGLLVPTFTGETVVDLPVPCDSDFSLAATRYFSALENGELPLGFHFSGTVFYQSAEERLQVMQIPWDREASFRLPVATWQELMDRFYPNSRWLCLSKDTFEQFDRYRSRQGLPSAELAMEQLLVAAGEAVRP